MKWLARNIVVVVWAFIFGEVLGFITSTLSQMNYNWVTVGIVSAVAGFIAINGFELLGDKSKQQAQPVASDK
ncbi:YjzD family protein [Levilactobacillus tangyuanensis]|uniref:YjzD family protein n=1 Tax=Levilactobacillus tangyuanensis TaxID=2486021 RepID=A0ABW1TKC1_9LACO|nr:YjzD family protein [Levilactobacillus tangyuanensis]